MDRRTFAGSLGAFYLASQANLFGGTSLLNNDTACVLPRDRAKDSLLVPVPASTRGVQNPVINLAGEWKFTVEPPADFWMPAIDVSTWSSVRMPNEFATQGFELAPNTEYPCRRTITVPAEFRDRRIFIRFDGVYGYARVWINGVYLHDHFGGFTSWDCEITGHVKPGEEAHLVLGITDRDDDISQASYYAKHSIAGILRDVRLFALPHTCLSALNLAADFDSEKGIGGIDLSAEVSELTAGSAVLSLTMTDPLGNSVPLDGNHLSFAPGSLSASRKITVHAPKPWDAEHPNLYTLDISLSLNGEIVETLVRKIGFRSVRRQDNQLLVNGRPIKLRGVCRHSIHPIYGRATPTEFDEMDAALLRAANINFVRTSHYPPTEQFLEACDRHGIYVEEETAVCWSNSEKGPSSNPEFRGRFLSQFEEMIGRDRGHASVLFWSLGNESQWGANFAAERRLACELDPDRPMIFSYPDTAPIGTDAADIYSNHYPNVNTDLSSDTLPVLNDEFAHVSCYNLETLRRDPGVRNFWGRSIKLFGENFLAADGCLGGSIWAGIDEVFLLPNGPEGYGPWGIIDGWRREKPEYWLTKKAYSPIRIQDRPLTTPEKGSALFIPVTNAFDHTNLSEIEIRWEAGADSGRLHVDLAPHRSGYLEILRRTWKLAEVLQLEFSRKEQLIDKFRLAIDPQPPSLPKPAASAATLKQTANEFIVSGGDFSIIVSKATGLIHKAVYNGQTILTGGPYLDLGMGPLTEHWLLRHCKADEAGNTVTILTAGECKRGEGIESLPFEFEMEIDGAGLITTRFRVNSAAAHEQQGITFRMPSAIDKLSWHRESLWSVYPPDHIGRPSGVALRKSGHTPPAYRTKPEWSWSDDMEDAFLWGKDGASPQPTNDFRSLKENIWYAACSMAGSSVCARAEACADAAVRASVLPDGQVALSIYKSWPYSDLAWGNYTGPSTGPTVTMNEVKLRLIDLPEEKQEKK
jgi:hypothetical protein